jgi:D-serine deaminase-like pyridoxal phosphate-dependent protein
MVQMSAIGQPREALDTPALLVDLDLLEGNISRMARTIIREAGVGWRPHVKGIKTPAIAHLLLEAGALGLTCAKLGEAEVMAQAGIRDLLIANQIVGDQKIARLVNLCRHADVAVAVDSLENAQVLGRAAVAKGVELRVVIEVDTGMQRAGVEPGAATLSLARRLATLEGLRFCGLMTWESPALRVRDHGERGQLIATLLGQLADTAQACREAGLRVEIVSCGGTGTYWLSAFQPGITEIQAGGGIFNDVVYCRHLGLDHPFALTVLSTVTSRPTPTRIVCDAGKKTMSGDSALPEPLGLPPVQSLTLSAEHGKLELAAPSPAPRLGDKIEFIPGCVDTTVVLHDELCGIRNGVVETIWPLLARGRLQ